MAERDFKGIWIPKEVWLAEDIGWSAKMLLVEIDSLATNRECFASNDYLGQFFGLGKGRISKLISELRDKGYIEVELVYKPGTKQIDKRRITTRGYRRKCLEGIDENDHTPMVENDHTPMVENSQDNNTGVIKPSFNNTRRKDTTAPMPETKNLFGPELQEAFEDWLQYKQERKEAYKPTGLKSLITEIRKNAAEYGEAAVAAEIRKSMSSGWRGIIFERLKEARQRRGGQPRRQEPVPEWMHNQEDDSKNLAALLDQMKRGEAPEKPVTVATDPNLASRAEQLRQQLRGG